MSAATGENRQGELHYLLGKRMRLCWGCILRMVQYMSGRLRVRNALALSGKLALFQLLMAITLSVSSLGWGAAAIAQDIVLPREKPEVPSLSALVNDADYHRISAAYRALGKKQWRTVRSISGQIEDDLASDLLKWHMLSRKDAGATFDEILSFAEKRSSWPRFDRMMQRAEAVIPDDMPPERVIAWFAGQEPLTGEGKIRLGEAFLAVGQQGYGQFWIQRAWVEHNFSYSREKEILKEHKANLLTSTHEERLTRLLWHRQHSVARRILPYVSKDARALAEARIQLTSGSSSAKSIIRKLPSELRTDPGILFDQIYGMRRRGQDEQARPLLLAGPTDLGLMVRPEKWWTERHLQARKAFKDKDYEMAYKLAASSGLERGADFAEAEFLAGWLALRFLDRPKVGYQHFEKLEAGVNYPISKARAAYWRGRAAEAMGDTATARSDFLRAGDLPYTFYGQLALSHPLISADTLILPTQMPIRDHLKWAFEAQDSVKAVKLLDEFGRSSDVRTFLYHIADDLDRADEFALLADLALELDHVNHSIRIAKKASQHNIALVEHSYPIREVPAYTGRGTAPDPALVFGLSRQESEFNPRAVSSAGARGLMQLMPTTARITAKKHKLPYQRNWLLDDPTYNTLVGMAHLSDLINKFDGSYIMTIASYNAGAGRINHWNKDYGDPREGEIDPIDWIESIPFKETRNYVQRVLENTQVYRNRLTDTNQPLRLVADLHRNGTQKNTQAMLELQPKPEPQPAGLGG